MRSRPLEKNGALYLFEKLKKIDPIYAEIFHPNNTKRLLHGLEFYELTGQRLSEHNEEQSVRESPYDFRYFVLTDDREEIYKRIDRRVDIMIKDGLEAEVRGLLDKGYTEDMQSMLGIGYKEMCDYIYGRTTLEEAIRRIKLETRHYAKKQLTWFKRERDVEFIDIRNFNNKTEIAEYIAAQINNRQ